MSLQIDGATPLVANWERLGGAAIERDDGAVTTIAAALAHGRQIRLHTSDGGGAATDATFAGPPGDAPVRRVLAACGYQLGQRPVRPGAAPATPPPAAAPASSEDDAE